MITPELHLQTAFRIGIDGQIVGTREPRAARGPRFCLVRGITSCAWAVRRDTPIQIARELVQIVADEPPALDLRAPPVYAHRYRSLIDGDIETGPALHFPLALAEPNDVAFVDDLLDTFPAGLRTKSQGECPSRQLKRTQAP